MKTRFLTLTLALSGLLVTLAGSAQATPTCTTTIPVANQGTVAAQTLLTAGTCVAAGDKLFGDFAVSGPVTANGSASFNFASTPGNVTLGFAGIVGPNAIGQLVYDVAINPALAQGFLIDDFQADFTLNAAGTGFASAVLAASTNPVTNPAVAILCTRTVNPAGGTCPEVASFAPVSDLIVTQTLTTDPNAIVTALTNTISQTQVSEPSSLLLLGTGLVGLGVMGRRRWRH